MLPEEDPPMNGLLRASAFAALSALGLVLAGCGSTVQIVRAPFVSPVVVPAPEVFKMNVAVKNFSDTDTAPALWLRVYSEYWPTKQPPAGQPPCSQLEYLSVGTLAPGQSWGKADYQIDRGSRCACVQNACVGHVWLSLHIAPEYGPHVKGPNTALHVNWSASGSLAEMTVSEF
jgi:hypothetical protein